jgi:hypothetical protein
VQPDELSTSRGATHEWEPAEPQDHEADCGFGGDLKAEIQALEDLSADATPAERVEALTSIIDGVSAFVAEASPKIADIEAKEQQGDMIAADEVLGALVQAERRGAATVAATRRSLMTRRSTETAVARSTRRAPLIGATRTRARARGAGRPRGASNKSHAPPGSDSDEGEPHPRAYPRRFDVDLTASVLA